MIVLDLPLLETLRSPHGNGGTKPDSIRQAEIAAKFVAAALDEYRHLDALDHRDEDEPFDRQTALMLRERFDVWATYAEALLDRVGPSVRGTSELLDAVGRTRAMLSVTLEDLDHAEEQIRRGETVSLEEVRRELRARHKP